MSRPSLLTPAVQDALVRVIAAGGSYKDACIVAGIGYRTFMTWMNRGDPALAGDDPDAPRYQQFRQAIEATETAVILRALACWQDAFPRDWRAARDYVQRRRPEEWGAKVSVKIDSERDEEILALLAAVAATTAMDPDPIRLLPPGDSDAAG